MTGVDVDAIAWPQSIRAINELDRNLKEAIYLTLVPDEILEHFSIRRTDRECIHINCPPDTRSFEIIVYHQPRAHDPVVYLQMADTLNYQIALLLFVVNDVMSERLNVDSDESGRPTRFGTLRRNIGEEVRAMEAGLAPGQVYRGLRISHQSLPLFEKFIARTGHDMVIIEPLTYNNAIVYERYGFSYFQGQRRMEWINSVLRPGGEFYSRFDDSTPFRSREAWRSIRGRAWAIHDGILGEPFGDIRMNKRVGHQAGVNTFPDGVW